MARVEQETARAGNFGERCPIAFAHRGGAALWPENTLHAFTQCRTLGPLVIETDARVTRDGHVVLAHDAALERTTNGHGALAALTLRELQRLDAGHWFTTDGVSFPERGRGHVVPTLEAALRALPEARFNIELKPGCRQTPELVQRTIEQLGASERVLVASAEHALIADFRRRAGGGLLTSASRREVLGFVAALRLGRTHWLRPHYHALQIPRSAYGIPLAEPTLIAAAHELGLAVHVWTINLPHEMRELLSAGVDGVMSDRPDLLTRACASAQAEQSAPR